MSVLASMWAGIFGDDAPIPEDADEAREAIVRALAIEQHVETEDGEHEGREGHEHEGRDGETPEGAGDGMDISHELVSGLARAESTLSAVKGRLQALEERISYLEAQPAALPVQQRGAPEESAEDRIKELERVIRSQRLDPDSEEVREVMRLYQAMRGGA